MLCFFPNCPFRCHLSKDFFQHSECLGKCFNLCSGVPRIIFRILINKLLIELWVVLVTWWHFPYFLALLRRNFDLISPYTCTLWQYFLKYLMHLPKNGNVVRLYSLWRKTPGNCNCMLFGTKINSEMYQELASLDLRAALNLLKTWGGGGGLLVVEVWKLAFFLFSCGQYRW